MDIEANATGGHQGVRWPTTIWMIVFHLGAVAALFYWSWRALIVSAVLAWVAQSIGVGMTYHRLLTHRSYKVSKPVEYLLTICATLSFEGGPINWVATHRIHHAHSDERGDDPHTPHDGRWWSHMGWILSGTAQQHSREVLERYAPDLTQDRFIAALNRIYFLPLIILAIILVLVGGWPLMLWGIFLRVTVGLHATWLVNSATHLWGRRRFETKDNSRNSWWVALLTWGEGWHNNHHAHPTSARHGLAWYEVDFNWWGIRMLQLLRLAKGVKLVSLKALPASRDS
ncbi:MAG: sn stearoyl-lipid 9-desaturase [Blastocatellia bacterium]|nr:sn stearoyl-lipid 9-desaturase [Blastocatellia bacterium]